jgi:hypothetical protein
MTPTKTEHANGNGNGGFNVAGWPKWAQIIFVVGPTACIAMWMVYQNTTRGAVQWDRIEARVEAHQTASANLLTEQAATLAALIKAAEQDRAQTRTLIALQRQVCWNTAKNDEARSKCAQ